MFLFCFSLFIDSFSLQLTSLCVCAFVCVLLSLLLPFFLMMPCPFLIRVLFRQFVPRSFSFLAYKCGCMCVCGELGDILLHLSLFFPLLQTKSVLTFFLLLYGCIELPHSLSFCVFRTPRQKEKTHTKKHCHDGALRKEFECFFNTYAHTESYICTFKEAKDITSLQG